MLRERSNITVDIIPGDPRSLRESRKVQRFLPVMLLCLKDEEYGELLYDGSAWDCTVEFIQMLLIDGAIHHGGEF